LPAEEEYEEFVRTLFEHGADSNPRWDADGRTPLTHAVSVGCEAIVKLLLEYGSDPNGPNRSGETPLWLARFEGYERIEALLLEAGAIPGPELDDIETTPLTRAAARGDESCIWDLLGSEINTNRKDNEGNSALWHANYWGRKDIVQILLAENADPTGVLDGEDIPRGDFTSLIYPGSYFEGRDIWDEALERLLSDSDDAGAIEDVSNADPRVNLDALELASSSSDCESEASVITPVFMKVPRKYLDPRTLDGYGYKNCHWEHIVSQSSPGQSTDFMKRDRDVNELHLRRKYSTLSLRNSSHCSGCATCSTTQPLTTLCSEIGVSASLGGSLTYSRWLTKILPGGLKCDISYERSGPRKAGMFHSTKTAYTYEEGVGALINYMYSERRARERRRRERRRKRTQDYN
jgi:hypothetical protein